jgi:hypothetical protein
MSIKRPFGVTLQLWMVLSLSAWGVIRLVASLHAWDVLYEYGASLSPLYLSITGAGWGVAGIVLFSGLWKGMPWARFATMTSIIVWLLEYWLERIFFQSPRANLPFALACSIVVLIVSWSATTLPGTKSFFEKSEEHEQPIENSNSE